MPYGIESLDSFGLIQPDGIICCMNIIKFILILLGLVLGLGLMWQLIDVVINRLL